MSSEKFRFVIQLKTIIQGGRRIKEETSQLERTAHRHAGERGGDSREGENEEHDKESPKIDDSVGTKIAASSARTLPTRPQRQTEKRGKEEKISMEGKRGCGEPVATARIKGDKREK